MLVLSRRPSERIVFPGIQAFVEVMAIKQGVVRLGIKAPDDVEVYRHELLERSPMNPRPTPSDATANSLHELQHAVRNRLNATGMGLMLLRQQITAGLSADALATLDRVDQEAAALRQIAESMMAPPAEPAACPRKRALVVEDDTNERELLAGLLRMAGLDVTTAGDGADALDYLRQRERPDVILLDMVLPQIDGPSTVRAIRSNPACEGLKIFGVTGHQPERFALAQGARGIDRWYPKPLDPQMLLRDLARDFAE